MKKKINEILTKIKTLWGFPQTWFFAVILVFAIGALLISKKASDEYIQSLFANIFAGLITGLVISFLAGTRQIYFFVQERKLEWLNDLHSQIKEYNEMHSRFLKDEYDEEESRDFVGEMCASLTIIGESALQSSYDRRMPFNSEKYCKKYYAFDPERFYNKSCVILDSFCTKTYPAKEDVAELLKETHDEVMGLYRKIGSDIKSLEVKVATAQRLII